MKRPISPKTSFLRSALAVSLSLLLLGNAPAPGQGLPRAKGAVYLEDFSSRPCRLRVLTDAPVYAGADGKRFLSRKLPPGQAVELVAIADATGLLEVRTPGPQGEIVGWVPPRYLSPPDPALAAAIKGRTERRRQVRALAANREIALNMTPREVVDILGPPLKKSSQPGGEETWEYPFFVHIPRQDMRRDYSHGRSQEITALVQDRIQMGTVLVTFSRGLVSAIEQRGVPGVKPGSVRPKTVPPPVAMQS